MRATNITWGQPRKDLIKALTAKKTEYAAQFPVLTNTHFSSRRQDPQAKQFPVEVVVSNIGFTPMLNGVAREYGFNLTIYAADFANLEAITEALDALISTIRTSPFKYVETETLLEDIEAGGYVRTLAVNAIVVAKPL